MGKHPRVKIVASSIFYRFALSAEEHFAWGGMMSTGFGRKGLQNKPVQTGGNRPFGQAIPAMRSDDGLTSQAAAFIAAERARQPENLSQTRTPSDAGLSSYAANFQSSSSRNERSMLLAYLLWFALGQLSIHRFYLGATQSAIAQVGMFFGSLVLIFVLMPLGLIMLLGWSLWLLADVFLIPGLHRRYCSSTGFDTQAFA